MEQTDTETCSTVDRFREVRALTEALAGPLSPEDQMVQSMADVSPTKWHRAHVTWFFETFLLLPELPRYRAFHPAYGYIFNSYYEAVGARHPRAQRGLLSRPSCAEVSAYRAHVDEAMERLTGLDLDRAAAGLVTLGLHHEQQHQELLLMDIKHVLSCNPLSPAYTAMPAHPDDAGSDVAKMRWIEHDAGLEEVGFAGAGFAFDNEFPRHRVHLTPFALADRLVTCGEWQAFIADNGYHRPELWLSDGWATIQQQGWEAPLYWRPADDVQAGPRTDAWRLFTLGGERALDPAEPVGHVSYYEADAFAHWMGDRLPTESEWEVVARLSPTGGNLLGSSHLHPLPASTAGQQWFGDLWEWTSSAYSPYPGFRAAPGAVGEYNGKFMVNQYVLRGGCCVTPTDHIRATYRNFFPASARWAFSGVRLARDL
jgi:ergothioneine biosynthesis protein EgtB